MSSDSSASVVRITFGSNRVTDYESFVVERDVGHPDEARIVLSGPDPKLAMAAKVEITYDNKSLYVGEVVSISTTYHQEELRAEVKAMNRLHRLNRGRRSNVFSDLSEQDIIKKVLADSGAEIGLAEWPDKNPNFGSKDSKSKKGMVVHWSNQTPMEFLAMRAARYGFHIWCVENLVYCKVPDFSQESKFALVQKSTSSKNPQKTQLTLKSFSARMSSSEVVEQVTVRASDPGSGDTFVVQASEAKAPTSSLGKEHAVSPCKDSGIKETFILDVPASSPEEANAIANAEFLRRSLTFIVAEAVVDCNPDLQLGTTVEVVASNKPEDPLNGGYYVTGLTHRFTVKDGKSVSYETHLRLARDAQKAKG